MGVTLTAFAKLNPCLNVLGTEGGLHRLDTVILPLAFGDEVEAVPRADGESTVTMSGGEKIGRNTALEAAKLLTERYGAAGVDVIIEKRIPIGAGLGGSSADAAAVFLAGKALFGIEPDGADCRRIGSDVWAQYAARPVRVVGTGGNAELLEGIPTLYVAVVAGGRRNSTAEVFRKYDALGGENGDVGALIEKLRRREPFEPFNALERSAENGDSAEKRKLLSDAGFTMIGMTGSGSAYAGYSYDPIPEDAVRYLKTEADRLGLTPILTHTIIEDGKN